VHISDDHLMGNLVQQMDFTVLGHWQRNCEPSLADVSSAAFYFIYVIIYGSNFGR